MCLSHHLRRSPPRAPRLASPWLGVGLCAVLVASLACVKRPPPIKSPPGATGDAPALCPVENGIDESGNPACAAGCRWDKATRQCAPDPAAGPPNATTPAPTPSADPAPGQPLPQLPPASKPSPPLPASDAI
jgi:hypothetical protein